MVALKFLRLFVLSAALVACGPAANGPVEHPRARVAPHASAASPAPSSNEPPLLSAAALATVPAGTFGPYLNLQSSGGLAIWAANDAQGPRSFYARPVTSAGDLGAGAVRFGEAPNELGLVTVRPIGEGFALVASHRTSGGEVVELSLLSASGERQAGPVSVGRTATSLLWLEALPIARGMLVLWASGGDGRASLYANFVTQKGEVASDARELARDAGAWQAVNLGDCVAVAVVRLGAAPGHEGPVDVTFVDNALKPSRPTVVSAEPTADLDLDMIALGERALLAWSDQRGVEARVFAAAVDASGKVVAAARPVTPAHGDQAVVRLVAPARGTNRAYLVWENIVTETSSHRSVEVSSIDAEGRIADPRARIEWWKMDGGVPEVVATPTGLAALTLAPLCRRSQTCGENAAIVPQFLEFDQTGAISSAEPLRLSPGSGQPMPLAWNMTCPGSCFALSAENGAPSPVFLARLEHRSDAFRAPGSRIELPPPPRVVSDEALVETDALAKLARASVGDNTLLGWITDFDPTTPWTRLKNPAPDGRFEPLRARIELRAFAGREPFQALSPSETLSLRAHSAAGVSISPGDPKAGQALVSWGGLDGGQPQVFLTLVDRSGKKQAQQMLTRKNGDLSDIVSAYTGDGYVVAWIDERSSDAEVFATKVSPTLARLAPEQRITNAPGAASDLSIVVRGAQGLLVWADARESEHPGWADIYAASFRTKDATRVAPETCLAKTRVHSFAPVAASSTRGTVVAWIEAKSEDGSEPARISLAVLDERGQLARDVVSAAFDVAEPRALALDCVEANCHVLVSATLANRTELYALYWADGSLSKPAELSALASVSPAAPLLHGREVLASDVSEGRTRVRRLLVDWQ